MGIWEDKGKQFSKWSLSNIEKYLTNHLKTKDIINTFATEGRRIASLYIWSYYLLLIFFNKICLILYF